MIEVKVKDAALREAAMQDMDAFLGVFINATKEAIGGELNAENMQQLSVAQTTLLAMTSCTRRLWTADLCS